MDKYFEIVNIQTSLHKTSLWQLAVYWRHHNNLTVDSLVDMTTCDSGECGREWDEEVVGEVTDLDARCVKPGAEAGGVGGVEGDQVVQGREGVASPDEVAPVVPGPDPVVPHLPPVPHWHQHHNNNNSNNNDNNACLWICGTWEH